MNCWSNPSSSSMTASERALIAGGRVSSLSVLDNGEEINEGADSFVEPSPCAAKVRLGFTAFCGSELLAESSVSLADEAGKLCFEGDWGPGILAVFWIVVSQLSAWVPGTSVVVFKEDGADEKARLDEFFFSDKAGSTEGKDCFRSETSCGADGCPSEGRGGWCGCVI